MASESVGFVGLGIMGSRQAANLAKAGYELTVFNRTRERAEAWVAEHGGTVAGSPREVAERSRRRDHDGRRRRRRSRQMMLGEDGALAGARDGTLFVDMSTIAPATARSLAERLSERGPRVRRRARHGLLAQGRGGHADDHGRRRRGGRGARPAAVRGDGREDRPRRRGRPGPGGQGALAGRHRGQLRHARPGDHRRRAGPGSTSTRCWRS